MVARYRRIIFFIALFFALVTTVIYFPSLHGEFVFDDIKPIKGNSLVQITGLSQLSEIMFSQTLSRKIGMMSFALNFYFGGFNTFGYHLVNVFIHIINGLLLFFLSYTLLTLPAEGRRECLDALTISALGSLIWLVHPIQSQAVSYIVQRVTSLSTLFFLLSLLCYIKGRIVNGVTNRIILFVLSLLSGLLALGTKQNAATLPLFIILTEFFFFQSRSFTMNKKNTGIIIACSVLLILISWIYLGPDFISRINLGYEKRGWTPLERILTQLRVILFYFSLLIYPHPSRLNLDHDFSLSHSLFSPVTTFLSLWVIIGFLTLAIFLIRRNRFVSFALLWFFGNLVIESSIIPLELVFEHRLYLPSMGMIMILVGLCVDFTKIEWKKWIVTGILLLSFLLSYWTSVRSFAWQSELTIWRDAATKSPGKARPHNNLGFALKNSGSTEAAMRHFTRALELDPRHADAHNNLGLALRDKGQIEAARRHFSRALEINPNFNQARRNLEIR